MTETFASSRRRQLIALAGAWGLGIAGNAHAQGLEAVKKRGRLVVAVYNDMPPFNTNGQGIDVSLAEELAKALGLPLSLLPFNADENMADDLRNMVWRGHYLGFGPADVMLHVPVDAPLIESQRRVKIFAPYYRERMVIARDLQRAPKMESLKDVASGRIAVPGQSLAGWLLIGADGGAYRDQLVTKLKDGVEAARLLQKGDVVAAAGMAAELEFALGKDSRYAIEPLPVPRMRDGWAVGCAVKAEATDLALAIQGVINDFASNGTLLRIFNAANVNWRRV
jgi:ABC-type amino acid transport substrate-binding protein